MDFTSLYSSASSILSPSTALLLTSTSGFLVLRDAASFQVLQSWRTGSASSKPWTQLAFSEDSRLCLAADTEAGLVDIYDVEEDKPVISIKAGSEGLQSVRWLANGLVAYWAKHGVGGPAALLDAPALNNSIAAHHRLGHRDRQAALYTES